LIKPTPYFPVAACKAAGKEKTRQRSEPDAVGEGSKTDALADDV